MSASPYLRQHAHQAIEWQEWGAGALALARKRDVPLFISIGYATCHWCHVMSRETFDNEEVAARLNAGFVSIKIDRQERPDLDHYYMTACMVMGRQGGWPLTILAFPDGRPFYAATYLPPFSRPGRAGLMDVLDRVGELWSTRREALDVSASEVHAGLQPATILPDEPPMDRVPEMADRLVRRALDDLTASFDPVNGGFGGAPKFPTFQHLRFLLRLGEEPATMASHTLERMLNGGIHDHVGGGIHRYSTDADWHEPHFEKMLHDQAGLLRVLSEMHAVSKSEQIVYEVDRLLDFLEAALRTPEGLFYAALDADTDGQEGLFYLWSREELASALSPSDAALAADEFGVGPAGRHVLDRNRSRAAQNIDSVSSHRLSNILARLAEERTLRPPPFRDENILVDWNGMVLGALSAAARFVRSERALVLAERLGAALWSRFRSGAVLQHRGFMDETGIDAQLDDYAWLMDGFLELAQVSGKAKWLEKARMLAKEGVDRLWDADSGTFMLSKSDDVPVRIPKWHDEAYESGSAIMFRNIGVLLSLSPDPSLEQIRETLERRMLRVAAASPTGFTGFLTAKVEERGGRGTLTAPDTGSVHEEAQALFAPDLFLLHGGLKGSDAASDQAELPEGTVLVCRNRTCDLPTDNVEAYGLRPFTGPP